MNYTKFETRKEAIAYARKVKKEYGQGVVVIQDLRYGGFYVELDGGGMIRDFEKVINF